MSLYTGRPYWSLSANTIVANGKAFGGLGFQGITIQTEGMVTNDIVQVQASNDGVNWNQLGSNITADGITTVLLGAAYYRARRSDITGGGTVDAIFAGS